MICKKIIVRYENNKKIWLSLLFANSIVCSPFNFYIGSLIGSSMQGLIYQAAKQGVNQRFVEYIKDGNSLLVTSFAMKSFNGQSLKVGCDIYIWGVSMMVPTVLLKTVFPQYINKNLDFGIGITIGNIILTSTWAQVMPEKQNPFVFKGNHVLIFTNNF